jgi:hypothetical protein
MLVAAVVAAACAVAAGAASAQVLTMTLGASPPNPVPLTGSVVLSGTLFQDSAPFPGVEVVLGVFTTPDCNFLGFHGFVGDTTTNGSGGFTFSPLDLATLRAATGSNQTSFSFLAGDIERPLSNCVAVTFGGEARQPDNTFLCYSQFEQDSGMVVPTNLVQQFLQGGYRKPFAVKGAAPSNAFTTAGAYYLSCNPPSSLKPTGFGVDLGGLDTYDMSSVFGGDPTIFPIVS